MDEICFVPQPFSQIFARPESIYRYYRIVLDISRCLFPRFSRFPCFKVGCHALPSSRGSKYSAIGTGASIYSSHPQQYAMHRSFVLRESKLKLPNLQKAKHIRVVSTHIRHRNHVAKTYVLSTSLLDVWLGSTLVCKAEGLAPSISWAFSKAG